MPCGRTLSFQVPNPENIGPFSATTNKVASKDPSLQPCPALMLVPICKVHLCAMILRNVLALGTGWKSENGWLGHSSAFHVRSDHPPSGYLVTPWCRPTAQEELSRQSISQVAVAWATCGDPSTQGAGTVGDHRVCGGPQGCEEGWGLEREQQWSHLKGAAGAWV